MYFAENRRFLTVIIDNAAVRRECGLPEDSGYRKRGGTNLTVNDNRGRH
ncbi:MAG: hypothetical protein HFH12_04120 [Dorea sp.]|nr:hypothetical protein [Dorea sp.]